MSGWIKLEKSLRDDPRVIRMASRLRNADVTLGDKSRALVIGALAQLWCYADTHVRSDDTLDLGPAEIDELVGVPGFTSLMPPDWLEIIDENAVKLPDFHIHNGTESKKKAVNQKRQSRFRNAASVTAALPDQDQTKTRPRPDQNRNTSLSASPTASATKGKVPRDTQDIEALASDLGIDPADVQRVFDCWRQVWGHQRAALDAKRRKLIRLRLRDYSADDLCRAIAGYRNSPHHTGQNDRATVYDALELFLRDAAHVDAGLRFAEQPPRAELSELTRRNVAAVEDWVPPEMREKSCAAN